MTTVRGTFLAPCGQVPGHCARTRGSVKILEILVAVVRLKSRRIAFHERRLLREKAPERWRLKDRGDKAS